MNRRDPLRQKEEDQYYSKSQVNRDSDKILENHKLNSRAEKPKSQSKIYPQTRPKISFVDVEMGSLRSNYTALRLVFLRTYQYIMNFFTREKMQEFKGFFKVKHCGDLDKPNIDNNNVIDERSGK